MQESFKIRTSYIRGTIYCTYRLYNSTSAAIISQMFWQASVLCTLCKSTMVEFFAHREVYLSYKNLSSFWVKVKGSANVSIKKEC